VEADADPTNRVGRPSARVLPHPGSVALAVNPEVDAIVVGVVGLAATVHHRVRVPLDEPPTPERTAELVAAAIADLRDGPLAGRRLRGIGLAVPGLVRADDGLVRWAPHLGWTDAPIARLVAEATGVAAVAGNDAGLGALAEHRFGSGRGIDDLVYLNGGAGGIGGGVIAGGRLLGGAGGYAGEFGHNRPGMADAADRRSPSGELEDEVSRAHLLAALGLRDADESGLDAAALGSTDPAVVDELARQRRVLSTALSNAVNVLNPSAVVLGGFLRAILASDPDELAALVGAQSIPAAWAGCELRHAALGADRLLIGAGELVLAGLIADAA
jgi:predicted NBD/HSP70 family sugar kinase